MTHRLITDYAKNYCNRALILKVIVENVVTCFLLGHSVFVLYSNVYVHARSNVYIHTVAENHSLPVLSSGA